MTGVQTCALPIYGDKGDDGDEGGNGDEEENHQDKRFDRDCYMHNDICEDYNSTTKIPAMEIDGNCGGGEGTSGKQGNNDEEEIGGDQVSAIKPVVSKKPVASSKAKPAAAKKPAPVKKSAATSKATKRKAGKDEEAAAAMTGNAAGKAKKMRLGGE